MRSRATSRWTGTRTRTVARCVALRLIRDNLERAVADTSDEDARGNMLVAASLAITISLGSTHSMSHPCGAHFGVPHGVANAINLPARDPLQRGGRRATSPTATATSTRCSTWRAGGSDAEVGDALAGHVERAWSSGWACRPACPQVGVPEEGIPALVEGAMGDGLTLLNPREPSEEDYEELFKRAL